MTLTHVQWEEGRAAHEERQCPRPGALSPFPLNVGVRGWTCCSQEAKGFMGMTFTHNHPPEASQLASLALFLCNPHRLLQWGCFGHFQLTPFLTNPPPLGYVLPCPYSRREDLYNPHARNQRLQFILMEPSEHHGDLG